MTADKTPNSPQPNAGAADTQDAKASEDRSGTEDVKAKFRAALKNKEHHDGPDVSAETGKAKSQESTHGVVSTKREFRRKTG